jgi:hypothetical protein
VDNVKALDVVIDSLIRDPRLAGLGGLSRPQAVVAELIAQDLSNKEIGRYLGVAEDGAHPCHESVREAWRANASGGDWGLATVERRGLAWSDWGKRACRRLVSDLFARSRHQPQGKGGTELRQGLPRV